MATRYYNRTLKCGCMISSDGGGGVIPCCYDNTNSKLIEKCNKAWEEWRKTKDYKLHEMEVQELNN